MNDPRAIAVHADPPSALSGLQATVIGAGIGGLAAALALCRRGASVSVLEQAPEISEVGAGLQISPNGTRVLTALGLDPAALGDQAEAVELRDQRGRLVTRMDLPAVPGFYLCHRADLIAGLAAAARTAGAGVKLLQRVSTVELKARAEALMRTGARQPAGLLIGADGVHSVLRPVLNGPSRPFFTGQVAWRATIPGSGGPAVVQVFMGPGRHLVSYPLRGGALRNIVAVEERRQWAAEGWTHADDPTALRAAFGGFGGSVPDWLASIEQVWLWGLFRHPVARRWHDGQGRAVILGDAAHATLPFLAQGANMALEDAWVLAEALAARPDAPAEALAGFEARRKRRCKDIVAAADRNARAYHLRAPIAPIGHAILRLAGHVAPGLALRRFAWVHEHDVTREAVP